MNTLRTGHGPLTIDNRAAYRQRLAQYDNERGWQNYDWTTRQTTESRWTTLVMVLMLLCGMALFAWSFVGYQGAVISAVVTALR